MLEREILVPLPRSFYEPTAEAVAALLLGHWLVRNLPEGPCGGPIVETEAYLTNDPAAHGFKGQTARNKIMFGPPGYVYVYFIYGFHFCVNAVCRGPGSAEAVLIRAVEAKFGVEAMQRNRPAASLFALTNGPGKLCAAMAIDRKLDGVDLCDASSPLFIARNPRVSEFRKKRENVAVSPRIGITKAAERPLRFYLGGSKFISRRAKLTATPSTE
jgi:DNA-3-methyladenine glycosylase